MTSDVKDRALRLIEKEDRLNEQRAESQRERSEESRLQDAIRRVRRHDREIEAERRRKEAAAEADALARERHELEERLEAEVGTINRSLAELERLDARHRDALRRAGRQLAQGQRLANVISKWWRARFGGWNALTGTPSPHWNTQTGPLHELDPLTEPVPSRTEGEAS